MGLAQTIQGPTPYIFVGKITDKPSQDEEFPTFEYKPYKCTKNPWSKDCLEAKWYAPKGKVPNERVPHYSVIKYVAKLKQGGKLPADVLAKIHATKIKWYRPPPS